MTRWAREHTRPTDNILAAGYFARTFRIALMRTTTWATTWLSWLRTSTDTRSTYVIADVWRVESELRGELAARYEKVQAWPFAQVYRVHPQPPPATRWRPDRSSDDRRGAAAREARMPTLSVVIPCYNEVSTIEAIVDAVERSPREGPRDHRRRRLLDRRHPRRAAEKIEPRVARVILHPVNRGKGAALRTGFEAATGDIVIVQDADLEYDPQEYPQLIAPILDDRADVVFGSRFSGGASLRVLYFWHYLGNRFLTTLSNMFTNLNLTDMETCYKVFRREVLRKITIEEDRFGFEPEITAKVAKLGCRIYEVGISYSGRTYDEGKKIGWRDGVRAIWCILKYNLFR